MSLVPASLDANVGALRRAQPFDEAWVQGASPASETAAGRPLQLRDDAGHPYRVPAHGQPEREAARWLAAAFPGARPGTMAFASAGARWAVEAVLGGDAASRVLIVESDPRLLHAFLADRDWSAAIAAGRLRVIGGGEGPTTGEAWRAAGLPAAAPLLVHPVVARRSAGLVIRTRALYQRARFESVADPRNPAVRRSMLHEEVLLALEHTAATIPAGILEIGAYVGGATAAIARGLRSTGHRVPFLTLERGGQYLEHPDLPSADILGDLRALLHAEGVADRVQIVEGACEDPAVVARICEALAPGGIGLLFLDADGQVFRDLAFYLPLCVPGARIAIDDYRAPLAPEKEVTTALAVDAAVDAGILRTDGVYGWGTWFGTLPRTVTEDQVRGLERQAA